MTRSYLPHTEADRQAMLDRIGVDSPQELFVDIPSGLRLSQPLALPAAMSEAELARHLQELAKVNANLQDYVSFLGAGAYDHYVPSVVDHVIRRSEFYTAYTQYQPEIAQGYLQALWEYQSMICEITGLEVANASLYDGGTALAEAAMVACNATGRSEVIVASAVHPHYRTILGTYGLDKGFQVKEAGYTDGTTNLSRLEQFVGNATAAVIIQMPNFFGCLEDVRTAADIAHARGACLIVAADPIALGVLEAPGKLGADIVVGEGQPLGLAVSFGGPYLGFFAATEKLMRKMPGRIVGQTTDYEGTRGFVLTLQAREQHIRREKAMSNICSNEALCALSAAVYLSSVGKAGFQRIAELCLRKAHYAYDELLARGSCQAAFRAPFFKEFVVRCPRPVGEVNQALLAQKMIGGLDLGPYYPELAGCMLIAVTEKRTRDEIDRLVSGMEAAV
jgi:glycine dehydrogenase subunit 1